MEVQEEVSDRAQFAERVADYVRRHDLCRAHGGTVHRVLDDHQRAFYSVPFSPNHTMDASICVYSHKYVLVRYRYDPKVKHLPPPGSRVFRKEADLYDFLDAAFVKIDNARTLKALEKST